MVPQRGQTTASFAKRPSGSLRCLPGDHRRSRESPPPARPHRCLRKRRPPGCGWGVRRAKRRVKSDTPRDPAAHRRPVPGRRAGRRDPPRTGIQGWRKGTRACRLRLRERAAPAPAPRARTASTWLPCRRARGHGPGRPPQGPGPRSAQTASRRAHPFPHPARADNGCGAHALASRRRWRRGPGRRRCLHKNRAREARPLPGRTPP